MSGLIKQFFASLTLPPRSAIEGRTILITGANTGLGLEAARHAARLGAGTIIMGVRSTAKGEAAKADIEASLAAVRASSINTIASFLIWPIDLSSFASVRDFAARTEEYVRSNGGGVQGRLDMAILNAGIATTQFALTADGWETSLQVNVLATTYLALRLLPLLHQHQHRQPPASQPPSLPAHLTLVTSDIHATAHFPERHNHNTSILSSLNDRAQWQTSQTQHGATERYAVTKLLGLWVAEQLAAAVHAAPGDKPDEVPVVVNAVAPGFCKTELLAREPGTPWVLRALQAVVARSAEEGSKALLHAATLGVEGHGRYLDHQAIACPGGVAADADTAAVKEKLWAEIMAVLKGIDPDATLAF